MRAKVTRIKTGLIRTRRLSAAAGAVILLALPFTPEGSLAARLALGALVALLFATALGGVELLVGSRVRPTAWDRFGSSSHAQWALVSIGVILVAGLAVQTWFRPGTGIGTGDITPPGGTAWLGKLFDPWAWTGSNLGEPSQSTLALPWAAILGIVHTLGGDPETAQRIWYTLLLIGVGLGAVGLMAALRLSPLAALVGTAIYLFNPDMVSEVSNFHVYIAASGLLATMPATLVAVGTHRLPMRWGVALVAAAAPIFGYVFFNPPLVGMVLAAMLGTPLLVGWVDGREAALKSLRALLVALPLLVAASAYWIVPAILHLSGLSGNHFSDLSSWTWTEARSSLRNAFWLNTNWAWRYPEYFPFAPAFEVGPVSAARFILPALAFSALALGAHAPSGTGRFTPVRMLRLAIATASVALTVIFLSTGTNEPGNVLFDRLYRLPFGWLLREPGRFLMLAALAYAVLVAAMTQALVGKLSLADLMKGCQPSALLRSSYVPLSLGTALLLGFPTYTGVIVPDKRPLLPPAHVHVPGYWKEMARFVDELPMQGAMLVMPPDDFYQMPYTWGYYGNDSFVVELFHRNVLVPNEQGYIPTSSQLMDSVKLTAQSILRRDWRQTEALVTALDAPLILVRRDVEAPFAGRPILPPDDLARALGASPSFSLLRQIGSLDLFALKMSVSETDIGANFLTINDPMPDLRLLSLLPPHTALVSGTPQLGMQNVVQAPPLELWQSEQKSNLVWKPAAPAGWRYRIADLDTRAVVAIDETGTLPANLSQAQIAYSSGVSNNSITVSVKGRAALSNGDFTEGPWGPVGDCNAVNPIPTTPYLSQTVVANGAPGGLPALRLTASAHSACTVQNLVWHRGPVVLTLMIHPVEGAGPRICLWEVGPARCALIPTPSKTGGWSTYRAAVVPDAGTTSLSLFLYADVYSEGGRTTNEYANVRAVEVSTLARFALLAEPETATSAPQLVVVHSGFSTWWQGTPTGKHVLVDGMLNGWLIPAGSNSFSVSYEPASAFRAAQWVSIATLSATLAFLVWWRARRLIRGRQPARPLANP